jgi:hypothetical protein
MNGGLDVVDGYAVRTTNKHDEQDHSWIWSCFSWISDVLILWRDELHTGGPITCHGPGHREVYKTMNVNSKDGILLRALAKMRHHQACYLEWSLLLMILHAKGFQSVSPLWRRGKLFYQLVHFLPLKPPSRQALWWQYIRMVSGKLHHQELQKVHLKWTYFWS